LLWQKAARLPTKIPGTRLRGQHPNITIHARLDCEFAQASPLTRVSCLSWYVAVLMTAVMSSLESLLDLDADHWPLDPKPGAHAYLDEVSRCFQPFPSTFDHMDDFTDFIAHTDGAAVTPQGSQSLQQQQASQAELALKLAVKPARPARQRVRSKEVNRRNQRSYREKKKVRRDIGTLHCVAGCGHVARLLSIAKSCCVSDLAFVPCRLSCNASKQSWMRCDKQCSTCSLTNSI